MVNLLAHPSNLVYLAGFIAYAAIRHVYEGRAKGAETSLRRLDGLEKALLATVGIGTVLPPLLYLFTPVLAFADYRPPAVVPWLGGCAMLAGLWLFWRSHADLGRNWSFTLELRKDHQLITDGVYHAVRHPMYAAIFVWGLAQALLLPNWFAGWSAVVAFTPMYLLRTPREEEMMSELFGDEYRQYMRRTGRLLPRLRP